MDPNWRTHCCDRNAFDPQHLEEEWLLTNGTGAYAMSTAAACNTRRYHGLLVAANAPPVGRVVLIHQLWDQIDIHRRSKIMLVTQTIDLATLMFRSAESSQETVFAPAGCDMIRRFERGLSVQWTYRWGNIEIQRELFLHWKQQAITMRYRIDGLASLNATATLRIAPMLSLRDFHTLARIPFDDVTTQNTNDALTATRDKLAVTCSLPRSVFKPNAHTWNNIYYPVENERGQEDTEDYFVPGSFVIDIADDCDVCFTAALGHQPVVPRPDTTDRAKHLQPVLHALKPTNRKREAKNQKLFAIASDDFVVDRTLGTEKRSTIIAGYPWFSDWGRDTFISLPGLLLATNRHDEAKHVLQAFSRCIRDGLVPNRFDDYHTHPPVVHYNTVDASLWFIHATFEYLRATNDKTAWKSFLRDAVVDIIEAYLKGTYADGHIDSQKAYIHVDTDGLVVAGHAHSQLTWMDAACGDTIFTPRQGKAVEINALWYSALMQLIQTSNLTGESFVRYVPLVKKVEESFDKIFWNEREGCLFDHVYIDDCNQLQRDPSIRPNQIFALSLPHSPLSHDKQEQVLEKVRTQLLVPMGLRTLGSGDLNYHPQYTGGQDVRDKAYHQGTTWPWLIGPYAEAVLRIGDFSPQAKRRAHRAITSLLEQLHASGGRGHSFGQLHEIFEAEPPLAPRPVGCIAQAWSIAQLLHIWRWIECNPS